MKYNGKEVEYPAVMKISFYKLIETLKKQAKSTDKAIANYAKDLLREVDKHPELEEGVGSFDELKKYRESVNKLSRALFPETLTTNEIKMLVPPFYFEPIFSSERFDNIIKASGDEFSFTMKDVDEDTFYIYGCIFILGAYYNFPVFYGSRQFQEIFNRQSEMMRTYKMLINAEMIQFIPGKNAVEITKDDYYELLDNLDNLELWKKKFPPNSWTMKGLAIVNFVDVTQDQAVNEITSNLLQTSKDTFQKVKLGIRNLLGKPKLKLGILNTDNDQLFTYEKKEMESVLLHETESMSCSEGMCNYTSEHLLKLHEPLIITDIKSFHEKSQSDFSARLLKTGLGSYIILPIIHDDEVLGLLELGAEEPYELHQGILFMLEPVIPILAMAQRRYVTESQNRLEAIIQQECTTIHPSVKWRFEEEAFKFMTRLQNGEQAIFKDIVFNNLYPLYGQMDIKGSSERRNKAVSKDLIKQLKEVKKVLQPAYKNYKLPLYEELIYRINDFIADLKKGLSAGSEHSILAFLREDVYPVFDHLQKLGTQFDKLIAAYYELLDDDFKTVYEERKKYDESVNTINQRLASFLDKRQFEAQEMFPHYFERYKTDGVEFNIYIGESITKNERFDPVYLRNLRIWQLLTMCEMENEYKRIQKDIEATLELSSLILVYNTPLAVHFRMDEKQFDVEGAYNARYEIIKKRVDKAFIKGTKERVTRPGSIAIVYSQESDAQEYRKYLKFLIAKGYLKSGIEDLALQDLQGIYGLRALRVEVAYEGDVTVDELIKEIEASSN